ncbi:uncharacterized protein LOC135705554 [Ochlerotatus camptorhynchus]|uniref:uncharacterized protein LOC135705554 n=1 Tax=Ochlerotatus camptorhynchus TaxID=644619 RepID=UPI0031D3B5BE
MLSLEDLNFSGEMWKLSSLGLILSTVCWTFTKLSGSSSEREAFSEMDSKLLARAIGDQLEVMVNGSGSPVVGRILSKLSKICQPVSQPILISQINIPTHSAIHSTFTTTPPTSNDFPLPHDQQPPSERLRLRDLIGRSQLQYIDYKVEYGLRYDPTVFANKFKRQQPQREQQHFSPSLITTTAENGTLTVKSDNATTFTFADSELTAAAAALATISNSSGNIMRPPTRVESAFELLGERLKVLILNSLVPNSTESRVIQKLKSPLTLFSLFNVIKFENRPCIARREQLATFYGICYHEMECSQLGGVPMDLCAGGFGVCCVFQLGCNDQTAQNISYFQSPNYPAAMRTKLTCSFTVALRWNVRQVLLEFIFFEMGPPTEGNCLEDQLIISVQNGYLRYPILCGVNSGQHLYLQIDRDYSHFLYLTAVSNSNEPKAFNIRITQLTTPEASDGCLQYHTGINGYIKSFNYEDQSVVVTNRNPSYLNNLNYAICIRRAPNFCTVTFENIGDTGEENQFQIVNQDEDGVSLIRPGTAGVEIYNCPDDYIAINYLRLCGERLNDGASIEDYTRNSPVMEDSAGPLVVAVRSNDETVGRGFKLRYRQELCQKG